MRRVEFNTRIHDGIIEIPKDKEEIKNKDVKVTIDWDDKNDKNFDATKIEMILLEIKNKKVFETITNPSAWQKDIRDDWE
jgi:hypothetical protein